MGCTKNLKNSAKKIGRTKNYKPISSGYNQSTKWTAGAYNKTKKGTKDAYTNSKKGSTSVYKDSTKKKTWSPVSKIFGGSRGSKPLGGDGSFDMFDGDPFNNFDPLAGISGNTGLLGILTSPAVLMGVGGIVLISVVM